MTRFWITEFDFISKILFSQINLYLWFCFSEILVQDVKKYSKKHNINSLVNQIYRFFDI